ncbi:MAG TPA: thioredoxin [Firmicutes bacterium]|jgi:thioredoxin 1|nr:thioredoxin [Bacillota bacterium]
MIHVTDANFKQEVLDHQGPVLVDFWAPWCMPCRILGPIIDKLANDYAGKVKVVKLNTDENPVMSAKYEIMAIPTMIIFKEGKPVQNISGLLPESQLKQVLDQIIAA